MDPQDPTNEISVETIPDIDGNAINAFYFIDFDDHTLYRIQMRTNASSSFMFIDLPPISGDDDY